MSSINLDEIDADTEKRIAEFTELPVSDVHKVIETLRLAVKVGEILKP